MKLVLPSAKYKKSFLSAVEEIKLSDSNPSLHELEINEDNFDEQMITYQNYQKGISLKKGHVPASTFWLVDRDEFIGRVQIRHKLNENLKTWGGHIGYIIRPSKRKQGYGTKILELGLEKAKELGFGEVLLTCDKDNIASRKIIEKNGGILQDEVFDGETDIPKLRFWINLE